METPARPPCRPPHVTDGPSTTTPASSTPSTASNAQETPQEPQQEHQHEHQHAPLRPMFPELLDRRHRPSADTFSLTQAVRKVVDSTGTGFVYGTLFGSVLAAAEGARASPKHQRLRGILHHARVMVPETAGKIAAVTCLFRATSLGLERARGRRDIYNTLLAATTTGGLLKARAGPKAAMRGATVFGSFAAVVLLFSKAEAAVVHHKASPEEVLEEIAFAEEMDEWDWEG